MALLAAAPGLAAEAVTGRVLRVGPGAAYALPSQAAAAARHGDTIEIAAGEYVDCAVWRADNLTIRGVGGRAKMRDKTCEDAAIWITEGADITIENVEFSGMRTRGRNGAGIRHRGAGLTVRNASFHDGGAGILGGGQRPGDAILVEDSEFAFLGRGGTGHAISIGRARSFTLRRSVVRNCAGGSHCIKTTAFRSVLSCNVIAGLEGRSALELALPEGGHVEVRDNVIEQGPNSVHGTIVSWGTENKNAKWHLPEQTLIFVGNTVINDQINEPPRGHFFEIKALENTEIIADGNTFIGNGWIVNDEGSRWFADRAAAGLGPYPALPRPCPPGN